VSQHQKGKTNLDFTEARDSEWQWHQLGHMQVCTSLQTDNHVSTPPVIFYRPDALPHTQPTAYSGHKMVVVGVLFVSALLPVVLMFKLITVTMLSSEFLFLFHNSSKPQVFPNSH